MAFYQSFYHPANTVVTIVGDIFSLKALGQIQVNFGDFKKATVNQSQQPAQQSASAPGATKTTAAASGRGSRIEDRSPQSQSPSPQPENPKSSILDPRSSILEEPPQDRLRYGNSRADM